MLVLARQINEKILIGDNIVIEVLQVRSGDIVRLGITAPREMPVDREEVRRRREADRNGD